MQGGHGTSSIPNMYIGLHSRLECGAPNDANMCIGLRCKLATLIRQEMIRNLKVRKPTNFNSEFAHSAMKAMGNLWSTGKG